MIEVRFVQPNDSHFKHQQDTEKKIALLTSSDSEVSHANVVASILVHAACSVCNMQLQC